MINSDPTGDPTSNGTPGGTDASSLNDQVVNDCPHTNTPSLGDGRCGSVSKPLLPLISVSDDTQAFFDSLNNPTDINLYDCIQNLQQNELRQDINDFLRGENNSPEAQGFALEAIMAMEENPYTEIDFEDKIINQLSGRALTIYNKLKTSSTGFKNSLQKFEPQFPVAHLKLELGDTGSAMAITISPNSNPNSPNSPDYNITVRLNNNNSNVSVQRRPELLIAKTIAHEILHAEIHRLLLEVLDNGGNITGVTRQNVLDALANSDYPGLLDYYSRYRRNIQHQIIAAHYRDVLAQILQEFDTGTAVPDNQQPQQLYMDLSWEGLIYELNPNTAVTAWTSLPQAERNRIRQVISDYIRLNSI